jgi:hypothetical protein
MFIVYNKKKKRKKKKKDSFKNQKTTTQIIYVHLPDAVGIDPCELD